MKLEQEAFRLRSSLNTRGRSGDVEIDETLLSTRDRVIVALDEAEQYMRDFTHQGWLKRRILGGAVYERVLSYLQAASEDLLLVEDE